MPQTSYTQYRVPSSFSLLRNREHTWGCKVDKVTLYGLSPSQYQYQPLRSSGSGETMRPVTEVPEDVWRKVMQRCELAEVVALDQVRFNLPNEL